MKKDINELFEMLKWNQDEKIQEVGRQLAKNIKYFSILFQPIEDKSVWENCAIIISEKTDEELGLYLYEMFDWLQDINWPGADRILKRLISMPIHMMYSSYLMILKKAIQLQDEPWVMSLYDLGCKTKMYDMLDDDIKKRVHYFLKNADLLKD